MTVFWIFCLTCIICFNVLFLLFRIIFLVLICLTFIWYFWGTFVELFYTVNVFVLMCGFFPKQCGHTEGFSQ